MSRAPKAAFAILILGLCQSVDDRIDKIIRDNFLEPIEPFWPRASETAWSGYSGVNLPLAPVDAPDFDLLCYWNLAELMGCLSTWSALNRYNAQHGAGLIERLTERIAGLWGEPGRKRTVDMDFHVRAWRGD
jgi:hypothetical protein